MKAFSLTVLFVLGGGACAAAGAVATNFTADGAAASMKQLGVSRALAEGAGESICTRARSGFLPFSGYGSDDVMTNTMNLAGVGSAAPDFSHFYGFQLDGYVYSDLLQGSGGEIILMCAATRPPRLCPPLGPRFRIRPLQVRAAAVCHSI